MGQVLKARPSVEYNGFFEVYFTLWQPSIPVK
jgi:hypothetical protein